MMRTAKRLSLRLVPLAVWAALALPAPAATPDTAPAAQRLERASHLIGRKLEDKNGWEVGRVEDLLIDPQTGRLVLAVLTVGGRFQANSAPVGLKLPSEDIVYQDGVVRSKATMEELNHLPALDGVLEDIEPDVRKRLVSGKALLGADLVDGAGNDVGGVQGFVVDLADGTLRFVVGDYDTSWTAPGKLVKLGELRLRKDDGDLALVVDAAAMSSAAAFSDPKWPGLSDDSWSGRLARWTNFH